MKEQEGKGNPRYRFELRAQIARTGFRTLGEFARALEIDLPRISRIVCGWEWPNEKTRNAMADKLKISLEDFVRLL